MKNYYLICILGLLMNCSSPDDPSLYPLDKQIYVYPYRTKLSADGVDTTVIIARLPKDAGLVDVSFSTSSGTFIYSGSRSDKQYARLTDEDYRYAKTILKSDTTPHDSVYITAEITKVRNSTYLSFIK